MAERPPYTGATRRLAEELAEDGITLTDEPEVQRWIIDELDHARRIPVFEGRRPLYGAFVVPPDRSIVRVREDLELLDVDGLSLDNARAYADGRSTFLVHHSGRGTQLACFDRPIQYEADLVALQEATGAHIIQRTAVLGVVRLFTDRSVVAWNGRSWDARPTASAVLPALRSCAPALLPEVADAVLDLAVHWLSPARIGATLVIHHGDIPWHALDAATASQAPALSILNRRHFPALFASLAQHDLATLITDDGQVEYLSVALLSSAEAETAVTGERGMRHRSAQRFSFDEPSTTVVVVSEDGPVTIYRGGRTIAISASRNETPTGPPAFTVED